MKYSAKFWRKLVMYSKFRQSHNICCHIFANNKCIFLCIQFQTAVFFGNTFGIISQ